MSPNPHLSPLISPKLLTLLQIYSALHTLLRRITKKQVPTWNHLIAPVLSAYLHLKGNTSSVAWPSRIKLLQQKHWLLGIEWPCTSYFT